MIQEIRFPRIVKVNQEYVVEYIDSRDGLISEYFVDNKADAERMLNRLENSAFCHCSNKDAITKENSYCITFFPVKDGCSNVLNCEQLFTKMTEDKFNSIKKIIEENKLNDLLIEEAEN